MIRSMLLSFVAAISSAAEPAILHVQVKDGENLKFSIENKYSSPVTNFEVRVGVPWDGLIVWRYRSC